MPLDKHGLLLYVIMLLFNACVPAGQTVVLWGLNILRLALYVESSWNVMAHVDARERKWRGNWRMEWVASTLHTTSEHGVSSITTADAHTSAASSRLKWPIPPLNPRPRRFKCTPPLRRKTKSGFYACAITFQTRSTIAAPLPSRKVIWDASSTMSVLLPRILLYSAFKKSLCT